jgi:hypothetical protein
MFFIMMIGEINRKRQEGNLVSFFGFTPLKTLRIFLEYRSLYPDGKLHIYSLAAVGRVRGWHRCHPLPSEPTVRLSPQ